MAYHPGTQAFYIPLLLSCEKGTFGSDIKRVEAVGRRRRSANKPDASESRDGIGELLAMHARTGASCGVTAHERRRIRRH